MTLPPLLRFTLTISPHDPISLCPSPCVKSLAVLLIFKADQTTCMCTPLVPGKDKIEVVYMQRIQWKYIPLALNIHGTNDLAANRSTMHVSDICHFGSRTHSQKYDLSFLFHWVKRTYTKGPLFLSLCHALIHTPTPSCLPCWLPELWLWEGGQIVCLSLCQGSAAGMRPREQLLPVWLLADGSIRLEQQGVWRWMRLNVCVSVCICVLGEGWWSFQE